MSTRSTSRVRRAKRVALGALAVSGSSLFVACLERPVGTPDPVTTSVLKDNFRQTAVDKIDLLFMIDNSASMRDKQDILRLAVPDLVNRLANPICVDSEGNQAPAPAPGGRCPDGMSREFKPVADIHVGVVSSSLGDAGAGVNCKEGDTMDMAHLIGSLPRGRSPGVDASGFLAWNPSVDLDAFNAEFQRMVSAVGEQGCGWEASLESWYRFLIDPAPYKSLERVNCNAMDPVAQCVKPSTNPDGTLIVDQTILEQRRAFLRPDSLVAIIMLSDENDCSLRFGGQTWAVANTGRNMVRGSAACAQNPNDPCCYACTAGPPQGCAADPSCAATAEHEANRLSASEDGTNMRCFEQKRRFGYDFMYPTARYVNALTQGKLCWQSPSLEAEGCPEPLVDNPLFAGGRDPRLVFLGGIVGVPWQALARATGADDRELGPDELLYKTASELTDSDWLALVGTPGDAQRAAMPPTNPWMIQSLTPRPGVTQPNAINGREYDTSKRDGFPNDLQYACIAPLPNPRACEVNDKQNAKQLCDCSVAYDDSPLCEERPAQGNTPPSELQHYAKAYPGSRQLEVLRAFGENSIPASICARNVSDMAKPDFGYRPAIAAIIDRLKDKLGDRCLPRRLTPAEDHTVACTLIEARPGVGSGCTCDPAVARVPLGAADRLRALEQLAQDATACGPGDPQCANACLCEVLQVQDVPGQEDALYACQNEPEAAGIEGWCYVAATLDQKEGNPQLVERCPATERRILRFVGEGLAPNSITLIDCVGSSLVSDTR